jgi:hypothetical protein
MTYIDVPEGIAHQSKVPGRTDEWLLPPEIAARRQLTNTDVADFYFPSNFQASLPPVKEGHVRLFRGEGLLPQPPGTAMQAGMGIGERPPQGPSSVGAMAAPTGPLEIDRIIAQSEEVVRQDRPGAVSALANRVPGVRAVREFERPGLKMTGENERILVGSVAERAAHADVASRAMPTRVTIGKQLEAAFGREAMKGGKISVPFIGSPDQAKSLITGRLKDIADNPELYSLTPEQTAALTALDARNTALLRHVVDEYGATVGQFPSKPGGAFLPNVDKPDELLQAIERESQAVSSGRGKTRFYESARARMEADKSFNPVLDINRLIDGMDNFKEGAASGQAFRKAAGGLTRAEAMEKTHPGLFQRMTALKSELSTLKGEIGRRDARMAGAIDDFMASPQEADDLADLMDAMNAKASTVPVWQNHLDQVKAEIASLRPAWKIANLKPYTFVQDGLYRYFPQEQAALISELRKQSNNPVVNFLEGWRGGAFSGDLSPLLGVQTPLGALFDPLGQFKMGVGAATKAVQERNILRSFSVTALADDIAQQPGGWEQFFSLMGRAPTGTPAEFAGGYLGKIPGYNKFTEATFIAVTRQAKGMWERMADDMIKDGVPELVAQVTAAGKVSEVFPLLNPARLGQSPSRHAVLRSLPTSYSFIRQPAALMAQATEGLVKMGLRQPLSPRETLAVKLMVSLAASVSAVSVSSAVISAKVRGEDAGQAALDAINPDPQNGKFLSLVLGSVRVPIGGPYRAIFRAVYPKKVLNSPVPVPFGGMFQFASNRVTPAAQTQLRLYKNRDFYGRRIYGEEFPKNIMEILVYEFRGAAPLALGTAVEGISHGASPEEIATKTIGQFAGANVQPTDLPPWGLPQMPKMPKMPKMPQMPRR